MKHLIAFFFGISLFVSAGRAQTQQPSNQQGNPPQAQSSTWTKVEIGASQSLDDFCFLNRDTAWVAGLDGLFQTTDGGLHWSKNQQLAGAIQVQFVDARTGWVLCLSSGLQHTTNGGVSWVGETPFGSDATASFLFVNADTGFAGRGGSSVAKTTDGGITWKFAGLYSQSTDHFSSPGYPYAYDVASRLTDSNIAPLHGLFDTEYTDINRTTDGGLTWKRLETRLQKDLYSVKALDSLHVVIGGNNIVAVTWDGGKTWNATFPQWGVDGFYFFDSLHGWLAGSGPGNFGADGLLAKTSDGGNTWTQISFDSVNISTGRILFIDSLNGWLLANQGLFHTTTGGADGIPSQQVLLSLPQPSNYPDPFTKVTTISYSLPTVQHVTISVFDVAGRLVATALQNSVETSGNHLQRFDGSSLPSGIYNYQITTEQFSATGKLNLVK